MITEHDKFILWSQIIRWDGKPIRIKIRKPKQTEIRKPIDGMCDVVKQTIFLTLPKPVAEMSQTEISEATAVLLHEYGHATGEYTERGAWRAAQSICKHYPNLVPNRFDEIKQTDLAEYKAARYIPSKNMLFRY